MIVLAICMTFAAFGWTVMVIVANGMRSSPGPFFGRFSIVCGWLAAAILWAGWFAS